MSEKQKYSVYEILFVGEKNLSFITSRNWTSSEIVIEAHWKEEHDCRTDSYISVSLILLIFWKRLNAYFKMSTFSEIKYFLSL